MIQNCKDGEQHALNTDVTKVPVLKTIERFRYQFFYNAI